MRGNLILIILLLIQQASIAQYDNANKRDSSKVLNAKYFYSDLENDKKDVAAVQLPFSKIQFTDVRYDTSFVAINWRQSLVLKTLNRKYDFNGGLASNLTRYFNKYYSTATQNTNKELVCYIKKFSITLKYELLEHFNAGGELFNETDNNINIEIECYYKTGDSLYPATRLDTTYTFRFQNHETHLTDAIKEMISPLMNKIERMNLDNIVKRTRYTTDQVSERYANRFNLPVLTTNTYKKGIYKNITEFKNNSPSIDSFSVFTDKLKFNAANVNLIDATSLLHKAVQKRNTTVFLYDASHELVNPSNIFGYCDGATFWIQHGAFFYPLVKTGNSFEFIYIYHYADGNQRTQTLYILMPLNMETGNSN